MAVNSISLTLETLPDAEQPLFLAIEALKKACEVRPDLADPLYEVLFESDESFRVGLVEVRSLTTTRTGYLFVVLDISDRFREIVATAVAGDVEQLAVYQIAHGGSREK